MITEDYVSFEIAKLLKEKGFDEATYHDYDTNGLLWFNEVLAQYNQQGTGFACPTLQMVMKWLREVHNIYLDIRITNHGMSDMVDIIKYYWVALSTEDAKWIAESTVRNVDCFKTYNEAIEDGIKYCLENLI